MPVEYSGIIAEHLAVRAAAGLFDVSHMGEIEIAGKDALAAVQHISSNDASRLQVNQAHYSALTTPDGTFVDDMLVYRFAPSHFLLVVNGSNVDKDYAWIADHAKEAGDVAVVNSSDRYALIAIQGPKARGILQSLTGVDLAAIKYYWFAHGEIAGIRGTVSRTGYTGEDGFEVFVPPAMAPRVWDAMLDAGQGRRPHPVRPRARATRCGSKRRCACTATTSTTRRRCSKPISDWIVGWKKPCVHRPRAAAAAEGERRRARKLVGFAMVDRAIARHGHPVMRGDEQVGVRHQRHADAVSEEGHRHGLRADAHDRTRHRARDRHPRPPREGDRGGVAVLQAAQSTEHSETWHHVPVAMPQAPAHLQPR